MDLIEGFETSAIINQTPGNYPKESLLYTVSSLKRNSLTQSANPFTESTLTEGIAEAIRFIAGILAVEWTTSVLPSDPTRRLFCIFDPDRSRLTKTSGITRGELSYLAPLGSENISAPYFKQCFFRGGGVLLPKNESNTTPPSPKTEITNILFYILNFASIIKFKM